MARESLSTGSKHVNIKIRPNGYRLNFRTNTNGTTGATGSGSANLANAWVRMQRVGNTFNTFTSTDGVNWTAFQSATVSMGSTIYVGLATAAKSGSQATTAQYRNYGDTASQPAPTVPTAASGLTAVANGPTSVSLNWSDNASNETGYRIERSTNGGSYSAIGSVGANVTTYTDTTAVASTNYAYRLVAFNAVGDASASNIATATTPASPNPGSDTTLTSVADGYVHGGNPSTNYGSTTTIDVKSASTAFTRVGYIRFDLSSLAGQTPEDIKLRLFGESSSTGTNLDIQIFGAQSSWAESTLNFSNRPAATTGVLATINIGTAGWSEVDVSSFVKNALATGQTSVTFMLSGAVTTSQAARFSSRESGANAPQLLITGTGTVTPQPPAAASGLTAVANGPTSVSLNWSDNASNETGYRIERSTNGGSYSAIGSVGANVTTYTDTTAVASTNYAYRLVAFNAVGDASASNIATATTPASPENVPALAPTADAYTYGANPTTNYGSATQLIVKYSASATWQRTAFMRFDIGSLATVTSAKLRLFANLTTADSVQIAAHRISGSWSESSLNFNNRPSLASGALSTAVVTSLSGEWIELDLTAFVQQALANGQTSLDIALAGTASSTAFVAINSRESASNTPQLVVA
jgi:titin